MLKLDNKMVGRTSWRPLSNLSWNQSFSIELDRVSVYGNLSLAQEARGAAFITLLKGESGSS